MSIVALVSRPSEIRAFSMLLFSDRETLNAKVTSTAITLILLARKNLVRKPVSCRTHVTILICMVLLRVEQRTQNNGYKILGLICRRLQEQKEWKQTVLQDGEGHEYDPKYVSVLWVLLQMLMQCCVRNILSSHVMLLCLCDWQYGLSSTWPPPHVGKGGGYKPPWWEIGRRCSRWCPAQQCIVCRSLLFICVTWKPVRDVAKRLVDGGTQILPSGSPFLFSLARSREIVEMRLLATTPCLCDCPSACLHVTRTAGRMVMKYDTEEFY